MEPPPLRRLRRKLTIENLWLYVVRVLLDKPTYAYDVKRKIIERFGFKPATITVYTVIYRLEREGILEKTKEGTYVVTSQGRRAYEEALKMIASVLEQLGYGKP